MARIITERKHVTEHTYAQLFSYVKNPEAGFSFECDSEGNIFTPRYEAGRANLAACLSGSAEVTGPRLQTFTSSWTEPAVLRCDCGARIPLEGDTECARCGRLYNSSGQELSYI